jgi:hypothetical protein
MATTFLKRYDERDSVENKPKNRKEKVGDRTRRPFNFTLSESQQERNFERFDKHCK